MTRYAGQKGQAVLRLRRAQGIPILTKTEVAYWTAQAEQCDWQGSLMDLINARKQGETK